MADTRKDKRAPVSLKVRFKSATVDEFIEHYCRDVSRGGIFIKSSQPMPVGTLLKFQLQLKDESSLIKGVGRVVWGRAEDDASADAPAGMGIKFIKMDAESREIVDRVVSAHAGDAGVYERGEPPPGEADPAFPEPTTGRFFPDLPPAQLPPSEDRTAVRHAAQFLATALSEAGTDEAARIEAEEKAAEALRRSAQIEAERIAAAEQALRDQNTPAALPSMIIDPSLDSPSPEVPDEEEERPTQVGRKPELPDLGAMLEAELEPASSEVGPSPRTSLPPPPTAAREEPLQTVPVAAAHGLPNPDSARKGRALAVLGVLAVVAGFAFFTLRDTPPQTLEQPAAAAPEVPSAEPEPAVAPEPAPQVMVDVKLESKPEGAEVLVNGEARGKAPLTLSLPKGVASTLVVRAAGYAELSREVVPGEPAEPLALTLEALHYILHIESTPPGASGLVQGKRVTTPADVELASAPQAPLSLSFKLPGHDPATASVAPDSFALRDGAMRSAVNLDLLPSRAGRKAPSKPAAPVKAPAPRKPPSEAAGEKPAEKPADAPADAAGATPEGKSPTTEAPPAPAEPEPAVKPSPVPEGVVPTNPF